MIPFYFYIMLFFCRAKCVRFVLPCKDFSDVVFLLRLNHLFYFTPSYTLDTVTTSKSCNVHFSMDSNFFKTKNSAFLLSTTKQEQEINY